MPRGIYSFILPHHKQPPPNRSENPYLGVPYSLPGVQDEVHRLGDALHQQSASQSHKYNLDGCAQVFSHLRLKNPRNTLLESDVHPKKVQERLGHSSIAITIDTYSHVFPSMHQDVTRKLDDLFEK